MIIDRRVRRGERWDAGNCELNVTRWEEPADPNGDKVSQDASAVIYFPRAAWLPGSPRVLRTVLADAVTPNPTTPSMGEQDGAVFAAKTTVESFRLQIALPSAARRANRAIHNALLRELGPEAVETLALHDRPRSMVAAVDLVVYEDGRWEAMIFKAGDCDVRMFDVTEWHQPITEMGYRQQKSEQWDEYFRSHPGASKQELIDLSNQLFSTPDAYDSTPIGAFPPWVQLKYSTASFTRDMPLSDVSFILTSDGLRHEGMTDFDFDRTRGRLEELADPSFESTGPYLKSRDDIATVAVGNRLTLLPDDVEIPSAGAQVIDDGTGFREEAGSSFSPPVSVRTMALSARRSIGTLDARITRRPTGVEPPTLLASPVPEEPISTGEVDVEHSVESRDVGSVADGGLEHGIDLA